MSGACEGLQNVYFSMRRRREDWKLPVQLVVDLLEIDINGVTLPQLLLLQLRDVGDLLPAVLRYLFLDPRFWNMRIFLFITLAEELE